MKINTKKCVSMPGAAPKEAMLRPNKFILSKLDVSNLDTPTGTNIHATTTPPGATKKTQSTDASSDGGRQVMYLPTIVYTPVQTSLRHVANDYYDDNNNSSLRASISVVRSSATSHKSTTTNSSGDRRRLLSVENVEALNTRLETLLLGATDDDDNKQAEDAEDIAAASLSSEPSCTEPFGRVEGVAFSYKTCSSAQVLRSARFQK